MRSLLARPQRRDRAAITTAGFEGQSRQGLWDAPRDASDPNDLGSDGHTDLGWCLRPDVETDWRTQGSETLLGDTSSPIPNQELRDLGSTSNHAEPRALLGEQYLSEILVQLVVVRDDQPPRVGSPLEPFGEGARISEMTSAVRKPLARVPLRSVVHDGQIEVELTQYRHRLCGNVTGSEDHEWLAYAQWFDPDFHLPPTAHAQVTAEVHAPAARTASFDGHHRPLYDLMLDRSAADCTDMRSVVEDQQTCAC